MDIPSTGIAAQGISAAIVYTAIDRISEMIGVADEAMRGNIDKEINAVLRGIPGRPDAMDANYGGEFYAAKSALAKADLAGKTPDIDRMPLFLDNAVGSFFEDYLAKMDALFPGLGAAGADADAFVRAALASAVGVSYNEQVDSTPANTAFLLARRQAYAQERQVLDAAASAGHRFAHGQALEGLARMHGGSVATSTEAITRAHAERLAQERAEKMRMATASLDASMRRVRKIHEQVAESFKLKLRARGMWINDQNQVVDASNNITGMNERFYAQTAELMRRTATRRFGLDFDERASKDRAEVLGKLKLANASEVVDLFGNMVTTLMNQVSAKAGYSGTERDGTDWDSIMA
ncbi:hypothetical protein AcdelDRAFT_0890 [Acidovorax delafieldii 2AN]|uniref:Uncharacterized protein n=1 Tax=Acidovorax delafieldii 2AN TaxID=573060 RepID=C5T1W0_ACIDE|nr:hypothetical protein [Acidovorax delafieldii]EER61555.1 hypothetical protein AcdelDRAFT_0890 [Acidovorax delafieldii 2AN]